jgi:endo-1,4-beta-xylanase
MLRFSFFELFSSQLRRCCLHLYLHLLLLFTLVAFTASAYAADPTRFIQDLQSKLPQGVSPVVFADNKQISGITVSGSASSNTAQINEPEGRFTQFMRVQIPQKGEKSYSVTAHSPRNTSFVNKGDWVAASFYVRATPGTGNANIRGFIERTEPSWAMIADASIATGEQWTRVMALGQAETDLDEGSFHVALHLASQAQSVDIAALSFISLPASTPIHVFPPTELQYDGMDPNAKWRSMAVDMIKKYRSNAFTVNILDRAGKPVNNRVLDIKQTDLDYELATMVNEMYTDNSAVGEKYQGWFNQFFNSATARIYWADWGWENPDVREENIRAMQKLQANNIRTRGHVLLYPAFRFSPESLNNLAGNKQAFIERVNQHIDEIVPILRRYGVNEYDVINELRDESEWLDVVGLDTVADWFKRVHHLHPEAILYINENSILTDGGDNKIQQDHYYDTITYLLEKGAPIHGIGMQGHFSGVVTPIQKMWTILDRFAEFGLPIRVTEYDSNTRDFDAQAQFDTDFYQAMYAHPATVGVTRWGFYEAKMWRPLGALVDVNDEFKPNAIAYLEWLNGHKDNQQTLTTNAKGYVSFEGLYGRYEVSIKGEDEVYECDFLGPKAHARSTDEKAMATPINKQSCTIRLPQDESFSMVTFASDFAELPAGSLSDSVLTQHYPSMQWAQLFDRVSLVKNNGKSALAVEYPKGGVGPQKGGAQFVVNLPPKDTYELKYSIKFEEGFDFRLGGKLPGLTSGGAKWTGGNRPLNGEGWSARLMWREKGLAELYLYYVDMQGKWGDSIPFDDYQFIPGQWYQIRQVIKVNEQGQHNASIHIYINDALVLAKQNFRLRLNAQGAIDTLFFSTFHGGNQPQWGPLNNSRALFADFRVSAR